MTVVPLPSLESAQRRTQRLALAGVIAGVALAATKLIAGLLGHSYALVADAIESLTDIAASVIVWSGLRYAARDPDESHPYGHGRAEALAALAVSLMICAAGIAVGIQAFREILRPHLTPAWWTLLVLALVILVKEVLFRAVRRAADDSGSPAARADAWHHRSDAITSVAAALGITIALVGGPGYESADDWAALLASLVIIFNGVVLLVGPINELMDRQEPALIRNAHDIALGVEGVQLVEKVRSRRTGMSVWLDMHVWVAGDLPVRDAHLIAHAVKDAIRSTIPEVRDVLVHIEPTPDERRREGL
ncbi:MAG: cation transporter [Phycisphaerae bacterium]|nr:cation transporter [Phycisphaerae bacterium]